MGNQKYSMYVAGWGGECVCVCVCVGECVM